MRLFTFLTALLCATTSLAANFNVNSDSELRSAIQNTNAVITLTADIDLSNSTLEITNNRTVTVNLNNHTLDRKLTKRGAGGGQVFTVRSGSTLIINGGGTLKGGWGGDGGALLNNGGIVELTNVTITGNTADDSGGGIFNEAGGTLTMNGCTVTDNHCNKHQSDSGGGGIYNAGTLNMQGANIVTNNTLSNVETDYVDFMGCYSPVDFAADDRTVLYMGEHHKLYYPNDDMTINSFRSYFKLKGITAGDQSSEARVFILNFGSLDATGITEMEKWKDGENETYYDLSGRKLQGKPTQKGIYIINGNKVINP